MGIGALVVPPGFFDDEPISWESLLAPYSRGAPLPDGFRVGAVRRGPWNDIVISVDRPGDTAAVEVHVLQRGRWTGVRESRSFAIGYEIPHSPASDSQRDAVTEVLAETIRSRDHGLPSPDAIPLGPSLDPSVLPSWLEALRGWRGLLLGASLGLLGLIVLVQTPGVGLAGLVLGATDLLGRAWGVSLGHPNLGATWLLPASAALFFLALRRRPVLSRGDRLLALAISAAAVSFRLVLGAWGPLHTNGYAPLFIVGAARDPEAVAAYGPGYVEVFGPIAGLTPSNPDWAIFAGNALISGLVPLLAFILARLAGLARGAALAGALLLAIDPVAIRMAASESYFPAIIFLCMGASAALLAATRELEAGGPWRSAACMAGAGLLLAQAARINPSAWGLIATVPFIALVEGRASAWPRPWRAPLPRRYAGTRS